LLRMWSEEWSWDKAFTWHFERLGEGFLRWELEDDDELLTARSIELDRWSRSWANAKTTDRVQMRTRESKFGKTIW
jgi:hypothetical protein